MDLEIILGLKLLIQDKGREVAGFHSALERELYPFPFSFKQIGRRKQLKIKY